MRYKCFRQWILKLAGMLLSWGGESSLWVPENVPAVGEGWCSAAGLRSLAYRALELGQLG